MPYTKEIGAAAHHVYRLPPIDHMAKELEFFVPRGT